MTDPTTSMKAKSTAPATQPQPEKSERATLATLLSRRLGGGVTKPSASKAGPSSGKGRGKKTGKKRKRIPSRKVPIKLPTTVSARLHGAVPPWVLRSSTARLLLSRTDRPAALDAELADFALYSRATPGETEWRDAVTEHVRAAVDSEWSGTRVDVFGSVSTGLCAPGSDIDMSIAKSQMSNKATVRALYRMKNVLKKRGKGTPFATPYDKSEVAARARVPVLKACLACGTTIDICFDTADGVVTRDTVRKYLDRYGNAVLPIFHVAKEALVQADLNDVSCSGLGSYTLFNMVVFHVQRHGEHFPGSGSGAGAMLRDFFTLWGTKIDTATTGVCIADEGYTYKRYARFGAQGKNATSPTLDDAHDKATRIANAIANATKKKKERTRPGLGVQDVNRRDNELGSNCDKIERVLRLFKACGEALSKWVDTNCGLKHPSALSSVIAVTDGMKMRREDVVRNEVEQGASDVLRNVEDAERTSPPKGQDEPLRGTKTEYVSDVMSEAGPPSSMVESEAPRVAVKEQGVGVKVDDVVQMLSPKGQEEPLPVGKKEDVSDVVAEAGPQLSSTSVGNEAQPVVDEKQVAGGKVDDAVQTSPPKGINESLAGNKKEGDSDLTTGAVTQTLSVKEPQPVAENEEAVDVKVGDAVPTSSQGKMKPQCGDKLATASDVKIQDTPLMSSLNADSKVQSSPKKVEVIDVDVDDMVAASSSQSMLQPQRGGTKRNVSDVKTDDAAPASSSREMKKVRLDDSEGQ